MFASLYRVYSAIINNVLMWIMWSVVSYIKETVYNFTICARYSSEMALGVDLDVSFDNMEDCDRIREKAWDVNSAKAYITNGTLYWTIVSFVICTTLMVRKRLSSELNTVSQETDGIIMNGKMVEMVVALSKVLKLSLCLNN
jgi:hypothetical protein